MKKPVEKIMQEKLMLLENFIDHLTSNEEEREKWKKCAEQYLEEDHVDGWGAYDMPNKLVDGVLTFETSWGEVNIRSIQMDLDDTNLTSGIEVYGRDIETFEVEGYYELEDMTLSEVETLLENNQ